MQTVEIGRRFAILNVLKRRQLASRAIGIELYPGQLHLLDCLIQQPGLSQQEVASRLGVTPASVAQSVKRLQRVALVEKRTDEKNLRCNRLFATASGIEAANAYRDCFNDIHRQMLTGFDEAEKAVLSGYLDRLIENLRMDDFDFDHYPFPKGKKGA